MKKILYSCMILFLTSYLSEAKIVFDPTNYRANLITQIESVKQTIEQVQHTKNQIEQLRNQLKQLENEAKNLKQIGKDLSSGNLNSIKSGLDKILDFDTQLSSKLFKTEDFLNQFNILYKTNEQISDPYKNSLENGINENRRALADIRKETSKVIFDTMKTAGYNPTVNDKRNLEMLISKANTTEGALQAIQAGNNILGQMALTLVEIRNILGKTAVMASAVSEETRTITNMEETQKTETLNEYKDENKKLKDEAKKLKNKLRNEKINVNWGGIR